MTGPAPRAQASASGPRLPSRAVLLDWQATGTARFASAVRAMEVDAFREPSALPGWSRAHVVTHVARNADALVNLLSWARTGVETPMYASVEARERDIEQGARRPADAVVDDLLAANARYAAAIADLPETAWQSMVRTAQGRPVAAEIVPWMRVREVWVHAIDIGGKTTFADLPEPVAAALLDDAVATIGARGEAGHLVLEEVGGALNDAGLVLKEAGDGLEEVGAGRRWELAGEGTAAVVRGRLTALAGYVLRGRVDPTLMCSGRETVPPAPRWL